MLRPHVAACLGCSLCWCAPQRLGFAFIFFIPCCCCSYSSLIIHAFHVGWCAQLPLSLCPVCVCVCVRECVGIRKMLLHGERHAVMLFPRNYLNSWSGWLDIQTRPSRAHIHRCNAMNTEHNAQLFIHLGTLVYGIVSRSSPSPFSSCTEWFGCFLSCLEITFNFCFFF